MLKLPLTPSTSRITQLERPQEVICLFEIRSNSENLMNQIFHTLNSIFPQIFSDESIVGQWDTGTVDFTVATFVEEMADGFEIGFAEGNVGLNDLEHFLGCFVESDEDAVVNLE